MALPGTWCCGEALAPVYYAPARTVHAMERCNIHPTLVVFLRLAFDVDAIKPGFFVMLDAHWDSAPDKPEQVTLAWQHIAALGIEGARQSGLSSEAGKTFTMLARQASDVAKWKIPRVFP